MPHVHETAAAPSHDGNGSTRSAPSADGSTAPPESVLDAADRVVEAARGVVLDHLALAVLEARALVRRLLAGATLVLVGALFLGATWGLLMATLYALAADAVPAWMRLGVITLATAIVGAVLVGRGSRRLSASLPDMR